MTDSVSSTTATPNEQLATKIVAAFDSAQLVLPAQRKEILTKLANGTATESDWKLWLDLPLMKKEAGR